MKKYVKWELDSIEIIDECESQCWFFSAKLGGKQFQYEIVRSQQTIDEMSSEKMQKLIEDVDNHFQQLGEEVDVGIDSNESL